MDCNPCLDLAGVSKSYGGNPVLRGLSLRVRPGEFVAVVGDNGAGKTTLLKVSVGLTKPAEGSARICGFRAGSPRARRLVGFVGDSPWVYEELSVEENIELHLTLHGMRPPGRDYYRLLESFGLDKFLGVRAGDLSHGWKRRLEFLRSIIHEPKLVVIDEYTTGLDRSSLELVTEALAGFIASRRAGALVTSPVPLDGGIVDIISGRASFRLYELRGGVLRELPQDI